MKNETSYRNAPDSFVGKNYAFRPYFMEAKQGNPSIYMALGATSGKRGIYFSHPVYDDMGEPPSGVLVIKDSNEVTEKELSHEYEGVMVFTDPHGVIFGSSREDWLFHTLWKISPDETMTIAKTRQFGGSSLKWTGVEYTGENRAVEQSGIEYHVHRSDIKITGAYNRRYFNEAAGKLFKLSIRHKRSLSALMLDIDYFKKVNDTYGHDIGDEVLKKVAQTCQRMTRETDLYARYGGRSSFFFFRKQARAEHLSLLKNCAQPLPSWRWKPRAENFL